MTSEGIKTQLLASTRLSDCDKREHEEYELKREHDLIGESQLAEPESQDDNNLSKPIPFRPLYQAYVEDYHSPSSASMQNSTSSESESESDSDTNSDSSSDSDHRSNRLSSDPYLRADTQNVSCIQDAQISPDSSCILTYDYDRTFSVYSIDHDIFSANMPRPLKPYAAFTSANPIWAFAVNPLFDFRDATSTHALISRRDSYINLYNVLWNIKEPWDKKFKEPIPSGPVDISKPLMSYKLINHLTEAVTAPLSLSYSHDGTSFFAGKKDGIAIFDLQEDQPLHTIDTIPSKRNKLKGGGRGFKGGISALSLSPSSEMASKGLLAGGARTRYIGVYDPCGGTEVTHFALPGTVDNKTSRLESYQTFVGDGVSHLKWSPCSRYLYIAERDSDALLIYDARNFSLCMAYCVGRNARTKQKLGFDIWSPGTSPYSMEGISHEIWAGGVDGKIRVWKDPHLKAEAIQPDEVIQFRDEDMPVVSTIVHPSGGLAVAACGALEIYDESKIQPGILRGRGIAPRMYERGRLDILALK